MTKPDSPAKPFSPACERNRGPILDVLRRWLPDRHRVLEIGSGTGQHAVHFAARFAHVEWQSSERDDPALAGIARWLDEAGLPNTPAPIRLDVDRPETWPASRFDAVFTANTLHYMPAASVRHLFAALPAVMSDDALLIVYGPFNIDGRYTSDSNAQFDVWLKGVDPSFAIRDRDWVDHLAIDAGLTLVEDNPMPANNRCLVWRRDVPPLSPAA
ncbi:MAG: DUF938 domain-containing protein [Burkholderiaceae bacterium]